MSTLFSLFLRIPAAVGVGLVFLLTATESALLVGLVVPGEVAAILGGVLAGRGRVPFAAVAAAAIAGACTGDTAGFFLGRRLGGARFMKHRRRRWTQARGWLRRRGGVAIFLGRFTPFLRTFMPSAAGAAKMPYARFLSWDLPTGLLWGAASTAVGYVGARDFERVLRWSGRAGLVVLAVVLAGAALLLHRLGAAAGRTKRAGRARAAGSGRRRKR